MLLKLLKDLCYKTKVSVSVCVLRQLNILLYSSQFQGDDGSVTAFSSAVDHFM